MSTNQFDFTALERALRQHLPEDLHGVVAPFLESLRQVDAAPGSNAQRIGAQPEVQPLLDAMAGQQVQAGGALISFGAGSQMGEVTIGDVAGRDIIKVSVTISMMEQAHDVRGLENPYLGLAAFTYAERDKYAGREQQVAEAVVKLTTPGEQRALLFITGASGSGKSSFAQAGLIPALEQHYQERHQTVRRAVFRPSKHPLAMLADALQQLGMPAAEVNAETFSTVVREHTSADCINVIIIDQFEELFTQSEPGQRDALFTLLEHLPPFAEVRTHLIATVRADYLPELFQRKELWERWEQSKIDLRAMTEAELKHAIQRPLQQHPKGFIKE